MGFLYNKRAVYLGSDFVYSRDCKRSGVFSERAGSRKEAFYGKIADIDRRASEKLIQKAIAFFISAVLTLIFWRWISVAVLLVCIGFVYLVRYLYGTSNKPRIFTRRLSVRGIDSSTKRGASLVEFSDGSVEYLPRGFAKTGDTLYLCLKGSKIYCIK